MDEKTQKVYVNIDNVISELLKHGLNELQIQSIESNLRSKATIFVWD